MLRTLLHRPIAVTMTIIAIVTLGVLALGRIPVSLMPDIDVPRIVVQMQSSGSSAREIEQRIVTPMRQQLSQVSGLKDIESTSRADAGTISLSFSPGSDMSLLFIDVNEKIDRAMGIMPKEMERPKVMKIGATDIPAFYVDVTGGKKEQTARLVTNVISKRMEQLPEVAMVDYSGLVGTQIVITPDIAKTQTLGITAKQIEKAITDNNIVLGALSVRDGIYRYSIHFDSQILSAKDIEEIYIRHNGRLLQLKELCTITTQQAERHGMVTSDGDDAVTMAVIKQSDAQMADLQQSIDTLMTQMRKDYPQLSFAITRDQTQLLSYSIENLGWNLLLGIIMASAVLFFFIGGWRLPLLVVVSIPLSLILTLLCFYVIGISINIISLSGLILGVGMIVDNAIIVIDNIRMRGGGAVGIVEAVKEVFMPMLSSVLTTCSVFIPLIFLSGTAGALFYDQAMGITIALSCSLAVAAIVVPVYYYALCKKILWQEQPVRQAHEPLLAKRLTGVYERGMHYCLRHQKTLFTAFTICLIAIVALFPFLRKERMPQLPHDDAIVTIDWNTNITVEENNRRMAEILTQADKWIEHNTTMVGGQDFMLSHTKNITGSEAVCYIKSALHEDCKEAVTRMGEYLTTHYPKARMETAMAANIFDMIFATDEPDLQIRLSKRTGGRPTVAETRSMTDSLRKRFPHLGIQPLQTEACITYRADAEMLAYYKVTYQQLYQRLKEVLGSQSVYDIASGGESIPVVITGGGREASVLLQNTITNSDGINIPMAYLVKEQRGEDYKHLIAGENGEYAVVNIAEGDDGDIESVMDYVMEKTEGKTSEHVEGRGQSLTKESSLVPSFTGGYFSSRSMIGELAIVMCVAILLLYFILAAQFESLIQPLIILAEIVIDIAIVMMVLFVMGESLNVMSMIGIVVMCGIIINDSILKVDTINRLYRSGTPLLRAIITAGHQRLKPIIMTSLTTVLAIVPFLSRSDMGSALQFPLSLTIIVGMIAGTTVSLFFVPLTYLVIYKKKNKR